MTNLEKLIGNMQNAPIEEIAYLIFKNAERPCSFCVYGMTACARVEDHRPDCDNGIKQWLESEAE